MAQMLYDFLFGGAFALAGFLSMLLVVIVIMFCEIRWTNAVRDNILVLIALHTGGGRYILAPKTGSGISITNPHNDTVRTWPLNELATIEVLYPGVGFIPEFLQKMIRMAIVSEGDWEQMLNRSPQRENIASPDIVAVLERVRDNENTDEETRALITRRLEHIATGPTREMIASPAVLGNLLHEKITEAILTVNKEVFDAIAALLKRMSAVVSPMMFYIVSGLLGALLLANLAFTIINHGDLATIKSSLGIGVEPPAKTAPVQPAVPVPVPVKPGAK